VQLTFEHDVAIGRRELFEFHEHPANLALLLAGWPGVRILRHAGSIRVGAELWIEQMFAGCVPVVMGFRHSVYEPPARFAEVLIHGPFERFHHVHEFVEVAGGTRVRDTVAFHVKPIFGGELSTRRLARPFIARMFAFRAAALDRLARGELALEPSVPT
jgi:ligand-binding SRPBCC domain-containing protein